MSIYLQFDISTVSKSCLLMLCHHIDQILSQHLVNKCPLGNVQSTFLNWHLSHLGKIVATFSGFYIPGGTQMFGKFQDLHTCEKACELTPTCFAGDYNPWLKKCFMHNNLTACQSMRTHDKITHFKKVPCSKYVSKQYREISIVCCSICLFLYYLK